MLLHVYNIEVSSIQGSKIEGFHCTLDGDTCLDNVKGGKYQPCPFISSSDGRHVVKLMVVDIFTTFTTAADGFSS